MAARFFEPSALVKRWVAERGTAWIRAEIARPRVEPCFVARMAEPEIIGALVRACRGRRISPETLAGALADLRLDLDGHLDVVEITPAIWRRAAQLAETHGLTGGDALHLAAALEVDAATGADTGDRLTFVAADADLRRAAATYGLTTDDPEGHAVAGE